MRAKPCYAARMNKPVSIKPSVAVEVVKIGDAHAIILPSDVLALLGVVEGDRLEVVDGGLKKHDAAFADAMSAAETVMDEDRDILAVLAR